MRFKRLRILFNKVSKRKEFRRMMTLDELSVKLTVEHPQAALMLQAMVDLFIDSGASHYLEMRFINAVDMNDYTVLIQRGGEMTPAEINAHLRRSLEQIGQGVSDPQATAVNVLHQMGYMETMAN